MPEAPQVPELSPIQVRFWPKVAQLQCSKVLFAEKDAWKQKVVTSASYQDQPYTATLLIMSQVLASCQFIRKHWTSFMVQYINGRFSLSVDLTARNLAVKFVLIIQFQLFVVARNFLVTKPCNGKEFFNLVLQKVPVLLIFNFCISATLWVSKIG